MPISRTETSTQAALAALAIIAGGDRAECKLVLDGTGSLHCLGRACRLSDGETVLIDRIEPELFGEGWADATPEQLLQWIDENA